MKKTAHFFIVALLCLLSFAGGGIFLKYFHRNSNIIFQPDNTGVKLDSTNLPIVFISTFDKKISRNEYITGRMKIIDNGINWNYGDSIKYPNQYVDFEGYVAIRYRGNSSYGLSDKKGYSIRALDKPLKDGGHKVKTQLLGMKKGKKWELIACHIDKSMVRNALTYNLASQLDVVYPQTRFVEVVIDGVYYGVYELSEKLEGRRFGMEKLMSDDDIGDYLLQIDARDTIGAYRSNHWNFSYRYDYPQKDKLSPKQLDSINNWIVKMENALSSNYGGWENYIDVKSMIDYHLITELTHNPSSTNTSTFLAKFRDNNDGKAIFGLWDYDLAWGNFARKGSPTEWTVDNRAWWPNLMNNPKYMQLLRKTWASYRESIFSEENIYNNLDSLVNVLTLGGAEKRNSEAWATLWNSDWTGPKRSGAQKYLSSSYKEEIDYLREWILKRLNWMDEQLIISEYNNSEPAH